MHQTKRMISLLLSAVITCSSPPATAYASSVSDELSHTADTVSNETTFAEDLTAKEGEEVPIQELNETQLESDNLSESETAETIPEDDLTPKSEKDNAPEPEDGETQLDNISTFDSEDEETQPDDISDGELEEDEMQPDDIRTGELEEDEMQPDDIRTGKLEDNEMQPDDISAPESESINFDEVFSAVSSENFEDSEASAVFYEEADYINPLYEDVIQVSDLVQPDESRAAVYSNSNYVSTLSAAGNQLREPLKEHLENITVYYQSTEEYYKGLTSDILEYALEHTGNPIEGDYLRWQFAGYRASISYQVQNGLYYMTMEYTFTYYTTSVQESELDQAIQQVLTQLNLNGKTDYEKIYDIYNYICQNVAYDYANLYDDSYKLKFTAYAALINKTAVCQGYALLFYRLALEAGIDARLISGMGNGGKHGWNIVRLNGVYYNLDATWDSSRTNENYSYFLKCDNNFSDHTRDPQYTNADFYSRYPMARKDYSSQTIDITNSTVSLSQISYVYTGSEIRPSVTVTLADGTLLENADYTISCSNNINVGTASITITGIGACSGSLTQTFKITPKAISNATTTPVPVQHYTGKPITPDINIMDGNTALIARKDYTVSYSNNIQHGTAHISVTGIGNYTGTLSISFEIQASPVNGWIQTGGKWYYYINGGKKTGWLFEKNKWYYLKFDGVMATDWAKIGNSWYYMNSSGVMQTGWKKISNKWYYMNSSGDMQTGWKKISNKWYYMNSSGVMQTGWKKISNKWYYMNSSGVMQTGWKKISNKWYYMNSSGVMQTGWKKISNKWYYMNSDGSMVNTNTRINGKMNRFNSSGVWLGSIS